MKRPDRFVKTRGTASCTLPSGEVLRIPIVPGLLKHPTVRDLASMLSEPPVARKYTMAALRRAPWPVLRQFPRAWLQRCMKEVGLAEGRAKAIAFMLEGKEDARETEEGDAR